MLRILLYHKLFNYKFHKGHPFWQMQSLLLSGELRWKSVYCLFMVIFFSKLYTCTLYLHRFFIFCYQVEWRANIFVTHLMISDIMSAQFLMTNTVVSYCLFKKNVFIQNVSGFFFQQTISCTLDLVSNIPYRYNECPASNNMPPLILTSADCWFY